MIKIALDAMGGDRAPRVVVEGAAWASREIEDCHIVLVGKERNINKFLCKTNYVEDRISIVNTPEVIGMDEPAAATVRKKKKSSISVGIDLLKERKVDAFVSAGNTGAVMCAATLKLRTLPGIERPGIGIVFPTLNKPAMIIDVGANLEARPSHLMQYGLMGAVYIKHILQSSNNPKVGLLNIGSEEIKGTDFLKETGQLLKKSNLNFVGNIEPKDIFSGKIDVIVCDGFMGNIVLKVTEAFTEATFQLLKRELTRRLLPKIGAFLSLPAYRAIKRKTDASEYGGAPLLGVDGRVLIGHGSSNAKAIKNSVWTAREYVTHKLNEHITEYLEKNK